MAGMVEDYEALRQLVLARQAGGPQLGRAVSSAPGWPHGPRRGRPRRRHHSAKPPRPLGAAPISAAGETVRLLAGMALAVIGAGS